jgi:hypothetical protein
MNVRVAASDTPLVTSSSTTSTVAQPKQLPLGIDILPALKREVFSSILRKPTSNPPPPRSWLPRLPCFRYRPPHEQRDGQARPTKSGNQAKPSTERNENRDRRQGIGKARPETERREIERGGPCWPAPETPDGGHSRPHTARVVPYPAARSSAPESGASGAEREESGRTGERTRTGRRGRTARICGS